MSSSRAQANHALYLAKIQLASWRHALAAQDIPVTTLTAAFLPAARAHLRVAYGWFLLAVTGAQQYPDIPPGGCADLSAVAEGKAEPPEIREFRRLEAGGWLAELLAEHAAPAGTGRTPGNLAAGSSDTPGVEQVAQWVGHLEALFERMSDSLDEY